LGACLAALPRAKSKWNFNLTLSVITRRTPLVKLHFATVLWRRKALNSSFLSVWINMRTALCVRTKSCAITQKEAIVFHMSSTITKPAIDTGTLPADSTGHGSESGRIQCPQCRWNPAAADTWRCDCGNEWNTFDTGGVCPGCMRQWPNTQCLKCLAWSAHSAWYPAY
jgi:hypothetical protein